MAADAFRFDTGSLVLDLVATVDSRSGEALERLPQPTDLARWLQGTGLLDRAAEVVEVGEAAHAACLALREAIHRTALYASRGEAPLAEDRVLINQFAALPMRVPSLDPSGGLRWSATDPVTAALGTIARDAATLIGGPHAQAIRACQDPRCATLFLDRSRGHRRRWCSMAGCGNRAKVAAHRQRARTRAGGAEP